MGSSGKSPSDSTLLARVATILGEHVKRGDRFVAGLSGGVDSVVLLDLLNRLSRRRGLHLTALHVNHQISASADRWAAFCRAYCRQLAVPLKVVRVVVPRGNSLEAAARDLRYREFAAARAEFVALAHNLDDQSETLLLQLLRGAGVKGASAMPVIREADRATFRGKGLSAPVILRPLLEIPRCEIERYAVRRRLKWVEDDSNSDTDFNRNFLRHRILPVLELRYPSYRTTLLRASRNFAEAAELLADLAKIDAKDMANGIPMALFRDLPLGRAKNVLRHYLESHDVAMPQATLLNECVRQLHSTKSSSGIVVDLGAHELRVHAQVLRLVPKRQAIRRGFERAWRGEARLALPELGGTLMLEKCRGRGISLVRLATAAVTVRARSGGERLRPKGNRPRRSLKNLLQEADVPAWERDRLPLLFCGQALVFVPGVGIDVDFRAGPGEAGVDPCWHTEGMALGGVGGAKS